MAIESVLLHTNRNAPAGADGVYLYNTGSAQKLTLGQLMAAVCLRAGAVLEKQSVAKMNEIGRQTDNISGLSSILSDVAEGRIANVTTLRGRLLAIGVADLVLPSNLNSYNARMQAMTALKQRLEAVTQQSQKDMIDLQTFINRRDVAFTTSTNLIRSLGQSKSNMAAKLAR